MMKPTLAFLMPLLVVLPVALSGQARVAVSPGEKLRVLDDNPLGLNLNTWVDDQANRPTSAKSMADALTASGLHYLRFPGGEKSDGYIWATAPYDDPSTATLLRRGPNEFPYAYPPLFDSLNNKWALDNYNFDEFMADCRAAGGEPVIAVALDNIYKPAEPGGSTLTREQTLELAVEWVRYANVTKKYGVKYWTLGNETWNEGGYNGSVPDFATYGADVREFATAMKAVDSTIHIGINADGYADFDRALDSCAAQVDFLDVHSYPCYGFTSYEDYRRREISALKIIEEAELAILYGENAEDRKHLYISMTETSAYSFMGGSSWDQGNNLGQALASFDLFAQLATDDRVKFAQYWNTRWIKDDTGNSHGTDLFTAENELNATGRILSLLSREMLDQMVVTSSTPLVRTFATSSTDGDLLTVFLLNKDTRATPTTLTLDGYQPAATAGRSEFRGSDATDPNPIYADLPNLSVGGMIDLSLPPASLTVLRFTGELETCAENHITGGGFEQRTIDPWVARTSGSGTAGRVEDETVDQGEGSGYVGDGEAALSQVLSGLQASTDYLLTANIRYYSADPDLPAVTLAVVGSGLAASKSEITTTQGDYQTVNLPFTTGPKADAASIVFSVADARVYGWIDEVSVRCNTARARLPVELLSFRGRASAEGNLLEWNVAGERELRAYTVEVSEQGRQWMDLATVPPTATDIPTKRYTYRDVRGGARNYRLRIEDVDGSIRYSPLLWIGDRVGKPRNLFPNPTDSIVHLPPGSAGKAYRITNARGRMVQSGTANANPLSFSALPSGIYYISILGGKPYRVIKR